MAAEFHIVLGASALNPNVIIGSMQANLTEKEYANRFLRVGWCSTNVPTCILLIIDTRRRISAVVGLRDRRSTVC